MVRMARPEEQQPDVAGVDEREEQEDAGELQDPADDVRRAPADAVRDPARGEGRQQPRHRGAATAHSTGSALERERTLRVGRVALDVAAGRHVADGVVAGEHERGDEHEQRVLAEELQDRHLRLLLALGELGEDRALLDAATHVPADEDQHDAEQERDAPAPLEERVTGRDHRHERHDARGEQQAERNADLRRGAESAAAGLGRVLDGHQHRAAPLAAGRDALQDAQQHEQDRRPDPDRLVGRQHADERRRGAHQDQRPHQHDLAAVLVAEVPGEERAERAEEEAHADGREGDDRAVGAERREEELAEDEPDRRRVDEEVVPLDGGADDGREDDASAVDGGGDGSGGREARRVRCSGALMS